jgi:hypothetical protein
MRKGLTLTLMTVVAVTIMGAQAYAMAPVISDMKDIVVGDEGNATPPNVFVYPDAINLDSFVTDQDDPIANLRWSYEVVGTQRYSINNVAPLSGTDDPVNPGAKAIDQADTDPAKVDANAKTITIRDIILSPIGNESAADPVTEGSQAVTLWVSDGEDVDSETIVIWTDDEGNDRLSPGGAQGELLYQKSFTDGQPGIFTFAAQLGTVTSSANASGLCIGVPVAGTNIGQWVQTSQFIDLVQNSVWRVHLTMNGTQTVLDQVPLWDIVYDNFTTPTAPNAYGGDYFFLGNEGGANAAGSAGRTDFNVYFTPMPIVAPQFANTTTGAFSPTNLPQADMRIFFRIIDADGAGYNAEADSGAICMENIEIWRYDLSAETVVDTPYDVQNITASTHSVVAFGGGTTSSFTGGDVTITPTNAAGWNDEGVTTINPGDNFANTNTGESVLDNWPVAWDSDELMKITVVLSGSNAAADTNPSDVIRIGADGPTTELLCANNVTPNFGTIATPKQQGTVGGTQEFLAYFYTHNETRSTIPNSHQIRPRFDIINVAVLQANGFTRNAGGLTMHSMTMEQVSYE